MTYQKGIIIRSVLIAVLGVTAAAGWYFSPAQREHRRGQRELFPRLSREQVGAIEIASPEVSGGDSAGTIRLDRAVRDGEGAGAGGSWILRGGEYEAPVPESAVSSFLESLLGERGARRAARGKEHWKRFGLTDSQAYHLRLRAEAESRPLMEAWFGRSPENPSRFYMRRQGDPAVYVVSDSLERPLRKERGDWVRKRIFPEGFTHEDIAAVSLRTGLSLNLAEEARRLQDQYTLYRGSAGDGEQGIAGPWRLDEPESVQGGLAQDKVETMMVALAQLRGTDLASPDRSLEDSSHPVQAVITTRNNREYTLQAGALSGDEGFYVTAEHLDYAMNIGPWSLVEAFPNLSGLAQGEREEEGGSGE